MKRVLSLLVLGLLAGCATYPDYGYYDNGRAYDRYRYEGAEGYDDNGGDYYYSTQPDRSYYYDDGYYGPYSSGYGYGYGGYGYGGYGYGGYGHGGYGMSLGYGFGSRPRIGIGFSSGGYGGYYPYAGYGGYYPYGGYYGGYYGNSPRYRYGHYDNRNGLNDGWLGARGRYGQRGDGVIDNDASDAAANLARQRGVQDPASNGYDSRSEARARSYEATPRAQPWSRDRDPVDMNDRNGWRSDHRDAQLASPRSSAAGGLGTNSSPATRLEMEAAEPRGGWRQQQEYRQSLPQTQPMERWRAPTSQGSQNSESGGWNRGRDAQPRAERASRENYAQPSQAPTQRFSGPAPRIQREAPSAESGSRGNYSRERDVNETL